MSKIIRGKNRRKPFTVRYWVSGRQLERSFVTAGEARDFKIKTDYDARARIFVDPRAGRQPFGEATEAWLSQLDVAPRSLATYTEVWTGHLDPVLGSRTLADVANDRDGVARVLTAGSLGALSASRRSIGRLIVTSVLDEAVRAGKIPAHRCGGLSIGARGPVNSHDDFVFPTYAQVAQVAEAAGIAVWLMRGCGLRIEEALAVESGDFTEDGTVLRVSRQADRAGRSAVALKHRSSGEFRDVPVPGWLWKLVTDLPDGPLCPGVSTPYRIYRVMHRTFRRAARSAGIPDEFTPHSLRHAFASALLARGVPITDLAVWLGHRDINTTYSTYGHLVPSAASRAAAALDDEYQTWQEDEGSAPNH
jgi:integrase